MRNRGRAFHCGLRGGDGPQTSLISSCRPCNILGFYAHGNQDLHQQKLGDGMFTGNCCEDGDENIMMTIGAGASDEYLNRFNNYTAQNWNINSNRKKAPVIWLVDILSPLNAVAPRFSVSADLSPLSGILGTKTFPPLAN